MDSRDGRQSKLRSGKVREGGVELRACSVVYDEWDTVSVGQHRAGSHSDSPVSTESRSCLTRNPSWPDTV